jgi:hypothetical protein
MADKVKKVLAIDLQKGDAKGYNSTLETVTNVTATRIDRIPGPTGLAITAQQIARSMANPQVDVGLRWNPPALVSPDLYQIQWSKNVAFSGIFTSASQSNISSIRVDTSTNYYVRVAAQKGTQVSEWSNVVNFTSIDDSTIPPAPSGLIFAWNLGHLEVKPALNTQTLKDIRLRFYDPTGTTLYKDIYVTQPYTLYASENRRMTGNNPRTSFLVRANNRSWTNVESLNTDTITTSPVPSGVGGITTSWDINNDVAAADLDIYWTAAAGASQYIVEINGSAAKRYNTVANTFRYTYEQNYKDTALGFADPSLNIRVWGINEIAQSGVASSLSSVINAAPPAPTVTITAGFSQISVQAAGHAAVEDFKHYRYRVIPPSGAALANLDTSSATYTYDTQQTGNYQVGVRMVDRFDQQGSETISSAVFMDTLTISGLRSQARYRDSIGTAEGILAGLKDTDTSTVVVTYASGTAWKWTECIRDLTDRYNIITLYNNQASTQVYIATSIDGVTWRWFSGPLASSKNLVEVANESAAITNAVTYSNLIYNRIEVPIHDARLVRLYSRNTGSSYGLQEYYPRRMLQSDDIQAESIQAINIASNAIVANHIAVGALDGKLITGATIRTSATNPKIILTSVSGLQSYNAAGTIMAQIRTSDGSFITGNNAVIMNMSGITLDWGGSSTAYNSLIKWRNQLSATIAPRAYIGGFDSAGVTTLGAVIDGISHSDDDVQILLVAQAQPTAPEVISLALRTNNPGPAAIFSSDDGAGTVRTFGINNDAYWEAFNGGFRATRTDGSYQYILFRSVPTVRQWGLAVTAAGEFALDDITGGARRITITTTSDFKYSGNSTGSMIASFRNPNAGAGAFTLLGIGNNTDEALAGIIRMSSANGSYAGANGIALFTISAHPLALVTGNAVRFYLGGAGTMGFFGSTGVVKQTIAGVKTGTLAQLQTVVANMLLALHNHGFWTDSTT